LHANVNTEQAVKLGLKDYSVDNAIRTSLLWSTL
jgi:hypothetical protein